jgi:hypothetical protein
VLWRDRNRNGRTDRGELTPAPRVVYRYQNLLYGIALRKFADVGRAVSATESSREWSSDERSNDVPHLVREEVQQHRDKHGEQNDFKEVVFPIGELARQAV